MKPYFETELGALYIGDRLEIIPQLGPVDLVLTDPPYGIDYQCAWRTDKDSRLPKIAGDKDLSFIPVLMAATYSISKENAHAYFFCRWDKWPLNVSPWVLKNMIVWDKLQHGTGDLFDSYGPQHELIAFATKGRRGFGKKRPVDIIRSQKVSPQDLIHSCQKPAGIISQLIENSSFVYETVLDSYIGSGTTAVACEQLNRRWIGIEISEKYTEVAAKRIERERQQLKLFGPVAERPPKPVQEELF